MEVYRILYRQSFTYNLNTRDLSFRARTKTATMPCQGVALKRCYDSQCSDNLERIPARTVGRVAETEGASIHGSATQNWFDKCSRKKKKIANFLRYASTLGSCF